MVPIRERATNKVIGLPGLFFIEVRLQRRQRPPNYPNHDIEFFKAAIALMFLIFCG